MKKKNDRFQFLLKAYEVSEGDEKKFLDGIKLGEEIGLTREEVTVVITYLQGEGLVKRLSAQGLIHVTHAGVIEVEQAIESPGKSTQHFPAGVINQITIHSMSNSQIQQGTTGSTQTQFVKTSGELEGVIAQLIEAVRSSSASPDQKALAESYSDLILSQARVPADQRDTGLVEKTWDKLRKLSTIISLGKFAVEAGPVVAAYFGLMG